jgi:hypothetical protein
VELKIVLKGTFDESMKLLITNGLNKLDVANGCTKAINEVVKYYFEHLTEKEN